MTTTCHRAIRSILECARLNAVQARQALAAGRVRLAAYHRSVCESCRRDAAALR
jgi:hypothetical protein